MNNIPPQIPPQILASGLPRRTYGLEITLGLTALVLAIVIAIPASPVIAVMSLDPTIGSIWLFVLAMMACAVITDWCLTRFARRVTQGPLFPLTAICAGLVAGVALVTVILMKFVNYVLFVFGGGA